MSPTKRTAGAAGHELTDSERSVARYHTDHSQIEFQSKETTVLARTSFITPGPQPATLGGVIGLDGAAAHAPLDPIAAGNALLDVLCSLGAAADELPCRVEDADLWFADTPGELDRAKQLCEMCPVRQLCLDAALARREPWGVWGGSIFDHGVVIAYKRPRGRPRKDARDVVAA